MANIEQQIEFFDIACPCIGVCQTGAKGYCKGCLRSREERQYWFQLDNHTKHKIAQACFRRKQALERKQQKLLNEEQLSFDQDLEQSLAPIQGAFEFEPALEKDDSNDHPPLIRHKNATNTESSSNNPLKKQDKKGQMDLF